MTYYVPVLPSFGQGPGGALPWLAVPLAAGGTLEVVVFGGLKLRKSSSVPTEVQKYFSSFTIGMVVPSVLTVHLP